MIESLIHWIVNNPWFALIGTVSIIEITPIKINPWRTLIRWVSKIFVQEVAERLAQVQKDLTDLKDEFEKENINIIRWNVLDFANSCRNKRKHTKEEWHHCLEQVKRYESLCNDRHIKNGVIEEETRYLRELYRELCRNNDFL